MGLRELLRRARIRQHQLSVAVFGLDGAGKTPIVQALARCECGPPARDGFQITRAAIGDLSISFWNIAGAESDRPFWTNYLDAADTIVFVVDATARDRLEEAGAAFRDLARAAGERCPGSAFLVLATRVGPGAMHRQEVIRALELKAIEGVQRGCLSCNPGCEASVDAAQRWLCDELIRCHYPEQA